jgi:hypothetical protein
MIALPAAAALLALACAGFVGWDTWRRPRPERVVWTAAFLLFALAAGAEVLGAAAGWTPLLARVYYLAGAVLVVGFLALGELYVLVPRRMPALVPALTLLVVALAATAVWSAPLDASLLTSEGWRALERGPLLVALAVAINAGGTTVLVGGALLSAWRLRGDPYARRRAGGCLLIALGAIVVASGGTLTRFGRHEYLYLAMSAGIAVIFAGVLLTRPASAGRLAAGAGRPRLVPLPARAGGSRSDEGIRFIVEALLPLDAAALAETCRRWSATPVAGDALDRLQARQVWALRTRLPDEARPRFDALPLPVQAQVAELAAEVWTPAGEGQRRA